MSKLTRYSPFSTEPFADAFEGFLRPMRQFVEEGARMDVDLSENDKEFMLQAELPGVAKEDIKVDIDGDQVRISASKSSGNEVKEDGRVLRKERFWGEIQRVIVLTSAVDEEKATANYENGVLKLVLPKKAGTSKRRLNLLMPVAAARYAGNADPRGPPFFYCI